MLFFAKRLPILGSSRGYALIVGASAVGVGTGLFYDPLICPKINAGIVEYLIRHGYQRVSELVGSLELNESPSAVCTG